MRSATLMAIAVSVCSIMPAAPIVPRPAGEFTYSDLKGKNHALSSLRGKVVLVQFLSTTCPHCQTMSQMLSRLQAEFGPQGFQAIGVAFNEATAEMTASYVDKHHVAIPVGVAPREAVLGYLGFSVMERVSVPQVLIIDRAGQVQEQSERAGTPQLGDEAYLREKIVRLLSARAQRGTAR